MPQNYRRCVSCRKLNHRSSFWRIVRVFPSHQLQLDQGMGRSVYLCPEAGCLKLAQKKDRLGRSLKLTVPESLYQTLWLRLTQSEAQMQSQSNGLQAGLEAGLKLRLEAGLEIEANAVSEAVAEPSASANDWPDSASARSKDRQECN